MAAPERFLFVHAHPEPSSFNGAMTRHAASGLTAAGHEVVVSDLYAMGFDPVSDRRNFTTVLESNTLNLQAEEAHANVHGGYTRELKDEMDKLAWCDVMILQFPIWWMGPPAILKGWIDRVFAVGHAYGGGRWFDRGVLAGKRAMCAVTVGGPKELYSPLGLYGPIDTILFPIHRGILGFCGFSVIAPFVVYGPNRIGPRERQGHLERYRDRVLNLSAAPMLDSPQTADYDGFVMKSTTNASF